MRFQEVYKRYIDGLVPRKGEEVEGQDVEGQGGEGEEVEGEAVSLNTFPCFKCYKKFGGMQSLFAHHRYVHNIHMNASGKIVCVLCNSSYALYRTYKRHMQSCHSNHGGKIQKRDDTVEIQQESEDNESDHDLYEENEELLDEHEDLSSETDEINDDDLTFELAAFIASMKKRGLSTSMIQDIWCHVQEMISKFTAHMHKTITSLEEIFKDGNLDELSFEEAKQSCTQIGKPFEELKSEHKQVLYSLHKGALVMPVGKVLGHEYKAKLNKSGRMVQVKQPQTFQYIPLGGLIKVYLEQPGMMQSILSYKKSTDETILESYRDGKFFKETFTEETAGQALEFPILIYSDEFEPGNPLGSRRGKHKLSAFYMQFLNIPSKLRSSLDHILLVALAETQLVSKYGVDSVLQVLVHDLEKLYQDGIYICSPGEFEGQVKPKLFQICGDNLGIHQLLGFACGFTANYPCRTCKAPRATCQEQEEENTSLLRTEQNFALDLEESNLSRTGISRNCILNEVSYYHAVLNFVQDTMHDFLEGVIPMEVKMILNHLIDEERITILELNSRISAFSYGFVDKQNAPSAISETALANPRGPSGQTASQMLCLFTYLPLMVGDVVDEDEECDVWELLLLLSDIYKAIAAPSISKEGTYRLQAQIREHHHLIKELFPDTTLTPKQHHMVHYPRAIRLLGPLQPYSSIRFEGKHKPLKNYARNSSNYVNVAKSVAKKHQMGQSSAFLLKQNVTFRGTEVFGQELIQASSLDSAEDICTLLRYPIESVIALAASVEVNGYRIKPSSAVIVAWDEELPTFGEVQHIVLAKSAINLIITPWTTLHFHNHYHSYAVDTSLSVGPIMKNVDELGDFRPVHVVKSYNKDDLKSYITLRYQLV